MTLLWHFLYSCDIFNLILGLICFAVFNELLRNETFKAKSDNIFSSKSIKNIVSKIKKSLWYFVNTPHHPFRVSHIILMAIMLQWQIMVNCYRKVNMRVMGLQSITFQINIFFCLIMLLLLLKAYFINIFKKYL